MSNTWPHHGMLGSHWSKLQGSSQDPRLPTPAIIGRQRLYCYKNTVRVIEPPYFGWKALSSSSPICSLGTIEYQKKMHKHKFTNPKNTAHSNKKPDAPATSSCQVARWAPYSDPLAGRLCQSPWPRIAPVGSHRSPESCLSLVRARIKSGKLGVIGRNNHLKAIENLGTLRFLPFSKAIFQINPKRMQLTQHGRNAKHPQWHSGFTERLRGSHLHFMG